MEKEPLTKRDIEKLNSSYLDQDTINLAGIFRVNSKRGAEIIGGKDKRDYSGIIFPYFLPESQTPREYRLRRDNPELEQQSDGTLKEKNKYLSPPGRSNLLYFIPNSLNSHLQNTEIPIAITEGEKKALALHRLSWHELPDGAEDPRFIPIGLSGAWNWRGLKGRTQNENGVRVEIKGPVSDLNRIQWLHRIAYLMYDSNVLSNESVKAARRNLKLELEERGAIVHFINVPVIEGVNGVDDLIAVNGPDFVVNLISSSTPYSQTREYKQIVEARNKQLDAEEETSIHIPVNFLNKKLDDASRETPMQEFWRLKRAETQTDPLTKDEEISNRFLKDGTNFLFATQYFLRKINMPQECIRLCLCMISFSDGRPEEDFVAPQTQMAYLMDTSQGAIGNKLADLEKWMIAFGYGAIEIHRAKNKMTYMNKPNRYKLTFLKCVKEIMVRFYEKEKYVKLNTFSRVEIAQETIKEFLKSYAEPTLKREDYPILKPIMPALESDESYNIVSEASKKPNEILYLHGDIESYRTQIQAESHPVRDYIELMPEPEFQQITALMPEKPVITGPVKKPIQPQIVKPVINSPANLPLRLPNTKANTSYGPGSLRHALKHDSDNPMLSPDQRIESALTEAKNALTKYFDLNFQNNRFMDDAKTAFDKMYETVLQKFPVFVKSDTQEDVDDLPMF